LHPIRFRVELFYQKKIQIQLSTFKYGNNQRDKRRR
jgi:hypothetical protein